MKRSLKTSVALTGLLGCLIGYSGMASAQSSDGSTSASPGARTIGAQPGVAPSTGKPSTGNQGPQADPSSQAAVGEIVVTAEKRSQSVNRVGLTIAAFSGDTLAKQGISNVRDLSKIVPGLTYTESASSTPVYTLRGVGFYETSLAAYPDVSVYVDQVPLPFPVLTTQAGLDLDRVEVIKGPQGILFGQNSTGGAINYVAAKPTHDFHAGGDVTYGRFNRVEGTGYVTGGLTDTLSARFSAKIDHGDDWQYSYTRNDTIGKTRDYVARLLLDWKPTDKLKFELSLNGWINKSDPQAGQYFAFQPQIATSTNIIATLSAIPFAPQNDRAADWAYRLRGNEHMYQAALRGDYTLSDDITLTSISSYVGYHKNDVDTNSGLYLANEDIAGHTGYIRSFTQEIRLSNRAEDRFRWTLGGNYEGSHVHEFVNFTYPESTLAEAFNVSANNYFSDQHMRNYAAFGNAEYSVTPKLAIKGGVRYTESRRSFEGCGSDPGDGAFADLFAGISSALSGQQVTIAPGACAVLDQFTFLPQLFHDQLNEHNVSWRGGVDYKANSNLLFYVNVAKGYKAGSFPTIGASTSKQYDPVTQESLLDYEGGFKAQLFDKRVSVSGAGFYYDYRNKQVRTKLIDPIFGIIDALANVPKSSVKGGEIVIAARPIPGFDVSGSATYLDTEVKKYVGVNGQGVLANFAGTPLPFSSKWQAAASGDYRWKIGSFEMGVGTSVTYHSTTFAVVGGGAAAKIDPYTLIDLRASLGRHDGRWQVTLWGRNITNKYYWTNVVHVYDTSVRYTGQPVTYGATLSFKI